MKHHINIRWNERIGYVYELTRGEHNKLGCGHKSWQSAFTRALESLEVHEEYVLRIKEKNNTEFVLHGYKGDQRNA